MKKRLIGLAALTIAATMTLAGSAFAQTAEATAEDTSAQAEWAEATDNAFFTMFDGSSW